VRILLVEDEARLARALVRGFTEEGHAVDVCSNAQDADEQLAGLEYDVVVLDWMLPDQDGLSLLRSWRGRGVSTPVLMLTARAAVPERVAGLRAGADDYLPKPFDFDELLARLEALYRRGAGVDEARAVGDVSLDVKARALVGPDAQAELTPREYALALRLFEHPKEVHTRTELLQAVWGSAFAGEPNVVDVYVGYLRKKLVEIGATRCTIRTLRGVGFRLEPQGEAP
jgi:two-component system OmpR family response regulator